MVYTWGYGNKSLADLLAIIAEHGIDAVLDVRRNAWSSNPDFTGAQLAAAVPGYEHHPELGNRAHRADDLEWTPPGQQAADKAIGDIAARARFGQNVLLLCAEADPDKCHRSIIADRLRDRHGIECTHITASGTRAVRAPAPRKPKRQGALEL